MANIKFRFRGFTTLFLFFSFLISLASGIVLYFVPQGKIARWIHWTFLGLDKEMWEAIHFNSSLVFFILAIFHISNNWNTLVRYIRKKTEMAFNLKYEFFTSLLFSIFIIWGTILNIQPFKAFIQWNDDIKDYWASSAESQPPIPHAEEMTVLEFCEQFKIPNDVFQKKLSQKGWAYLGANETIEDLAKRNGISPADIYDLMQSKSSEDVPKRKGSGWGSKSLKEVCSELRLELPVVIKNLAKKGIAASGNESLKNIADRYSMRPVEIVELIKNQE